jgi:hypothetical protein
VLASAVEGTSAGSRLPQRWRLRRPWRWKRCKWSVGDGDGLSGGGVGGSVCVGGVGSGGGDSTCLFFVLLLQDIFVWLRFSEGAEKSDFLMHEESVTWNFKNRWRIYLTREYMKYAVLYGI